MERVHDIVDKFLGQSHAPLVDGSRDQREVDMFLRLSFLDDGFGSPSKCPDWLSLLAVSRDLWYLDYSQRSTIWFGDKRSKPD